MIADKSIAEIMLEMFLLLLIPIGYAVLIYIAGRPINNDKHYECKRIGCRQAYPKHTDKTQKESTK